MKVALFKLRRSGDSIIDEYLSMPELPAIPRKGELLGIYNWGNSSSCNWEAIIKPSVHRTEYDVSPLRVVEVMYRVGYPGVEVVCVYLAPDKLYNEILNPNSKWFGPENVTQK